MGSSELTFDVLQNLINEGWQFMATRLTEKFTFEDYMAKYNSDSILPILKISAKGSFTFAISDVEFSAKDGDLVISFVK